MWEFAQQNPSFFAIVFSALFGGSIAIIGIWKQRETAVIKNTIDFEAALGLNTTYDGYVEQVRQIGFEDKEGRISVACWADKDSFDRPQSEAIRYVLNVWERAANGVSKKVFDSHFLYEIYGTHVITLHDRLLPYIKRIRTDRQKKAFSNFIKMAEQWKEWRELEPNEKLEEKIKITVTLDVTKLEGSGFTASDLKDHVAKALPEYTVQQIDFQHSLPTDNYPGLCMKFESTPTLAKNDSDRAKRFIETTVLRVAMEKHLG